MRQSTFCPSIKNSPTLTRNQVSILNRLPPSPNTGEQNPLLQLRLNRPPNRLRLRGTRPTALHKPILADEELLEIPLHTLQAHQTWLLFLHPLPDGLGRGAVDVRLAEHFVADFVVEDAEVLDFRVAAGLLTVELVAGEGEDFEVGGVLGLQVCVSDDVSVLFCFGFLFAGGW